MSNLVAKSIDDGQERMRLHLFEFEDQSWFPDAIRSGGSDYLRYFLIKTELYQPVAPLISEILEETGETMVIDLCSGGGGCIEYIYTDLVKLVPGNFTITLTDKFPNLPAYRLIKERTGGNIDFCSNSVDVFNIPKDLRGLRVLFSSIHHFEPYRVEQILDNAVKENTPIAFFDGGEKGIFAMLGLIIIHPIAFLAFTPFFRPLKFSRLFFTYVIPLIPLYTIWDGVVSILRMYEPEDLLQIALAVDNKNYINTSVNSNYSLKEITVGIVSETIRAFITCYLYSETTGKGTSVRHGVKFRLLYSALIASLYIILGGWYFQLKNPICGC